MATTEKKLFGALNINFHHYNYAYPGWQPEGIRNRIRQGEDGPDYLEPGAEIEGHLHEDRLNPRPQVGDEYFMVFNEQLWLVKLTDVNDEIMKQDDPDDIGYEIQGVCIELQEDDV